jgi:hypothetical protein
MTEPEGGWESVPPDEWPFVYLIHHPGEYVIDGEITYRDLYGHVVQNRADRPEAR